MDAVDANSGKKNDDANKDPRTTLIAGPDVSAAAADSSAKVTFTGATGLSLKSADFEVTSGGTIILVSVSSDTVTISVTFAPNTDPILSKTYTVSIASCSTKIVGTETVAITHEAAGGTDTRTTLNAGPAVSAAASDTGKSVTFTGATGLSLSNADFAVTSGGTITSVSVSSNTATVSVSFAANTFPTFSQTYTVSIDSGSTIIKGTGTVAITQSAAGSVPDTRKTLNAGQAVSALDSATTANVTFTGATGLSLSNADFEVTSGGTLDRVAVTSDTATVSVNFAANTDPALTKTFTVSIASGSTKIKGTGTVVITQAATGGGGTDTRKTLAAGPAVSALASDTSKSVSFTGATGLSLSAADFEVTSGGTITGVNVSSDTATVSVSFAANASTSLTKTFTVSIASGSTKIKGTGTVAITQAVVTDTRAPLAAGPAVSVVFSVTAANATFTGAAGLSLGNADFEVSSGGTITGVSVNANTATVSVSFAANASTSMPNTYTVSIASGSTKIKGTGTVAITQGAVTDTRATLTPGSAVNVAGAATTANVTFIGASGLSLSAADFAVSTGGTISGVSVSSNTATVSVSFAANTSTTLTKSYTVSIASSSTNIKGTGTVAITQAAAVDTRKTLTAGSAVSVAASATTANVTFTGASGLSLSDVDFTLSSGTGAISGASVTSGTATVSVSFAANSSSTSTKTYTVAIASSSTNIKGSATVTITQAVDTSNAPVQWYISPNDDPQGAIEGGGNTVKGVLTQISSAKSAGKFSGGTKAVIVIHATLTPASEGATGQKSLVVISGVGAYPPLVLRGGNAGGTLDAQGTMRVLNIAGNNVTIATGLTLTNGNTVPTGELYGGGIFIENTSLTITGGAVTNSKAGYGGGVYINGQDRNSNLSTFTMSGGTISGCVTDNGKGAGVFLEYKAQFTLTGTGLINDNGLDGKTENGGGIFVNGNCDFTMSGGGISGNMAYNNGGGVANYSKFDMSLGTITNNTAPVGKGSGVFTTQYGGVFTHTGGTVSGNHGAPDIVP
ncbi:MAG: hypothetical protein LBT01_00390 [Spirochaetaceae bacterium]|nr:hypothetical protein [Spirochaetaceae bacterium]